MNLKPISKERKINFFFFIRVLIGILFIVSGMEKLVGPYQNFLYVIQSYKILPDILEEPVARLFPWLELLFGIFVFLGLWLRIALIGVATLLTAFIIIVGQAIGRQLPITECGCFGELITIPLPVICLFDSTMLLLTSFMYRNIERTSCLSLDDYFSEK